MTRQGAEAGPSIFEVSDRSLEHHRRLPSETRDFVPTPLGWAAILAVAAALAWLIWQLGGDEAGVGWLVTSAVLGYAIAAMAWGAIRRARDEREDRAQQS